MILKKYFRNEEIISKKYVLMILTPVILIFLVSEYISKVSYGDITITNTDRRYIMGNSYDVLVIQILSVVGLYCVLYAYRKLSEALRLSIKITLLEQEACYLNQYVGEAKMRYEKTKAFRHDVKNHLSIVKELIKKNSLDAALHYIGDMQHLTADMSFPVNTNNPILDILLGNKLGIAEGYRIKVQCSLFLPYPCGTVKDIDLCIIFANALDNAITACGKIRDSQQKYIDISGKIQGDFLMVEIQNSYHDREAVNIGTGIANIKAVTEKYHGAFQINTEENLFTLSVLLVISQQPKDISLHVD